MAKVERKHYLVVAYKEGHIEVADVSQGLMQNTPEYIINAGASYRKQIIVGTSDEEALASLQKDIDKFRAEESLEGPK